MPKLYDYFGFVVNGLVEQISYSPMAGRAPLPATQQRYFEELVESRADAIVAKWIDFFVLNKPIQSESITRRIK